MNRPCSRTSNEHQRKYRGHDDAGTRESTIHRARNGLRSVHAVSRRQWTALPKEGVVRSMARRDRPADVPVVELWVERAATTRRASAAPTRRASAAPSAAPTRRDGRGVGLSPRSPPRLSACAPSWRGPVVRSARKWAGRRSEGRGRGRLGAGRTRPERRGSFVCCSQPTSGLHPGAPCACVPARETDGSL